MTYVVAVVMSIVLNIFLVLLKSIANRHNRPEPIIVHSARHLVYCGSSDVVKGEPGWAYACDLYGLPTN